MFEVEILFLLVIDWILRTIAAGGMNGIKWILLPQLDDLDFDDDLVLFHTTTIRCRKRQLAWQLHQHQLDSIST